eukprot:jgi/Hompol1/2552/HPOL_002951-RA
MPNAQCPMPNAQCPMLHMLQSEAVVDVYKRDLNEFVQTVAAESTSGIELLARGVHSLATGAVLGSGDAADEFDEADEADEASQATVTAESVVAGNPSATA